MKSSVHLMRRPYVGKLKDMVEWLRTELILRGYQVDWEGRLRFPWITELKLMVLQRVKILTL